MDDGSSFVAFLLKLIVLYLIILESLILPDLNFISFFIVPNISTFICKKSKAFDKIH